MPVERVHDLRNRLFRVISVEAVDVHDVHPQLAQGGFQAVSYTHLESLDYKSKKYDELSGQIGDAMIEAKRNADQIIAEANGKAAQITDQAHAYMRNFYSELGSFKGDAARLRKSIEEILFVLNDRIDVMQEVVRQVEKKFGDDTRLDYTEEQPPFSEPDVYKRQ